MLNDWSVREAHAAREGKSRAKHVVRRVSALVVIASAITVGAATPAGATPVSFLITGAIPGGEETAFPVGTNPAASVLLSYDPDLAGASLPRQVFLLEPSAQFSARWGDL